MPRVPSNPRHEAGTSASDECVEAFLADSVNGRIGRAARRLARRPEMAGHDVRTAVVLGDAVAVEAELRSDPGLVSRTDPRWGWTALHGACGSRWHVDPARAQGLRATVGLLLEAGADPEFRPDRQSQWTPLRCAVASAASGRGNEPIIRLLLQSGAGVADTDLYLAAFAAGGEQWCLRLLLARVPDVRAVARHALAAPISRDDTAALQLLLDAGADPNRYLNDEDRPTGAVPAAIDAGCGEELIERLLEAGADPNACGADGRSAYRLATASACGALVDLLERHGARDDATPMDRLQGACSRGDRDATRKLIADHPDLRSELAAADASALISAIERGDPLGVELLLEAGFPVSARGGPDGASPLHAAAYVGNAPAVRRLLAAGAELEARDSTWDSTPLQWALVGSGEHPTTNPRPDWIQTVSILLDRGAATRHITLSADDPKPPSPEVAALLRERGIPA